MAPRSRRFWIRLGLAGFVIADVLGLLSLALVQGAGLAPVQAWTLSLVMSAPVVPMAWAAAEWVMRAAERADWGGSAGDTVP